MAGRIGYPGRPGRAGGLLDRADGLLLQSAAEGDPRERFRTAYLAALRGAGAVLAITGADRAPRARSRNAWVLMQQAAPEFVMWADYFSSFSETRAAIEARLDPPGEAPRPPPVGCRGGGLLPDGEGQGSS
uniref:SAV_6107 family HEPN domain-containing protein n=1 Tax=Nocardia wallacei TaxID=480035 RepID=UPI0024571A47